MSDDLGPACAELAALIPALIPALSRDSVPSALSAGRVVNPDVLHAMIILAAEIPAACAAASQVTGEPWQRRPSAICLRAIPRLHHQLTALGMPAAARDLETGVHHWTRMVKLALGPAPPTSPSQNDRRIPSRCAPARECCRLRAQRSLRARAYAQPRLLTSMSRARPRVTAGPVISP